MVIIKILMEKKGGVYSIPCKVNGMPLKFIFLEANNNRCAVTILLTWLRARISSSVTTSKVRACTQSIKASNAGTLRSVRTLIKRSMATGYAGLDNDLFYNDKTMMIFGDAKKVVEDMTKAINGGGH